LWALNLQEVEPTNQLAMHCSGYGQGEEKVNQAGQHGPPSQKTANSWRKAQTPAAMKNFNIGLAT
jgi:hypothetical protein